MDTICNVCEGLGVVQKNVPFGHPDFGKTFPCPGCTIYEERRLDRIQQMSRLAVFADKTFQTFDTEIPEYTPSERASLQGVVNQIYRYVQGDARWLVLRGGTGTGKTHLAAAVAHEFVYRGVSTIFITTPDLLDHLRMTFSPQSEVSYDQLFETLYNVELLVLDDLGAESATPWAQEKLYQLINHRYNTRALTVFTTNNLELERLGERIASRMEDKILSMQITLNVPDFRRSGGDTQDPAIVGMANLSNYKGMRFDTLDTSQIEPEANISLKQIIAYSDDPKGWMLIVGGHRTGKTHLAASIAHHRAVQDPIAPLMVSTNDLLDYLRATFSPDTRVTLDSRFQAIRRIPLLILDDFRLSSVTNWSRDKLFQLVDYRYLNYLPTIFTITPPNLADLEKNHEDFFRRIMDRTITTEVELKLYKYRQKHRED
jgi:DNA replication protein DnaC